MTKELKSRILENKVLTHDERMEIINALEIVEEFEKAQIITGGRLNGRTYAYKCGLEDGKRKALEQPITQEILSHIDTGITATGQSDSYCVGFCNALVWLKSCITHEEPQFFEDSKVSEISTGSTTSDDCVSRQATLDAIIKELGIRNESYLLECEKPIYNVVKNMPPNIEPDNCGNYVVMQPTVEERKVGKWIENDKVAIICSCCNTWFPKERKEFMWKCPYCFADMRGSENG